MKIEKRGGRLLFGRDEWQLIAAMHDEAAADFHALYKVLSALEGIEGASAELLPAGAAGRALKNVGVIDSERVAGALLNWQTIEAEAGPISMLWPPSFYNIATHMIIELATHHHTLYKHAAAQATAVRRGPPKKAQSSDVKPGQRIPGVTGRKPAYGLRGADLLTWVEAPRRHGQEGKSEAESLRELARETLKNNGVVATDQTVKKLAASFVRTLSRHRQTLVAGDPLQPSVGDGTGA